LTRIAPFSDHVAALKQSGDGAGRARAEALEDEFKSLQEALGGVLANLQPLVAAKQAGAQLLGDSQPLLKAFDDLGTAYADEARGSLPTKFVAVAGTLAALVLLLLIVRLFNNDAARRGEVAERQRRGRGRHDATQEAILRLMNEMGDLADGDLTARATVSEDITGAIADSVNYTIEELAVLVKRINDAANRLTNASEAAQKISNELLGASRRQSGEIVGAGTQVRDMAKSMEGVAAGTEWWSPASPWKA
jgi:twitching motility protein PilJ